MDSIGSAGKGFAGLDLQNGSHTFRFGYPEPKTRLGRETTMDSSGIGGGGFVGLDLQNGAYGSHVFHFAYPKPCDWARTGPEITGT